MILNNCENMEINVIILAISTFLLSIKSIEAASKEWKANDYPNPRTDPEDCGRKDKRSYVCDPDGVITYEQGMLNCVYI